MCFIQYHLTSYDHLTPKTKFDKVSSRDLTIEARSCSGSFASDDQKSYLGLDTSKTNTLISPLSACGRLASMLILSS